MSILFFISSLLVFLILLLYSLIRKKTIPYRFPLLPRWFKIISIIILASCAFVPDLLNISKNISCLELNRLLILLGLLLFSIAKEKTEAIYYNNLRVLILFLSILIVTTLTQINFFVNIITVNYTPLDLPITILFVYLFCFHIYIRKSCSVAK